MRIVYTRAIKKPPSGSGVNNKNKTWYLSENMNFLKPYINITLDKSLPGNLPSPPNNEEFQEFEEENSTELNRSDIRNDIENSTYDVSSCSISADTNADTTKTTSQYAMGPPQKKKKTQVDTADDCIINYIQSKSNKPPKEDNAKKLFLLSLLPDLEEMNTVQFRAFRRNVGNLIDRTLGQSPIPYLTSNNYQTTFQHHSDSSSYDGHSHTSEQNSSEIDHPNMLYQELQPYLLRRPENLINKN